MQRGPSTPGRSTGAYAATPGGASLLSGFAPSPIQSYDLSQTLNSASKVIGNPLGTTPAPSAAAGVAGMTSAMFGGPDVVLSTAAKAVIPFNLGIMSTLTPDPTDPFDGQRAHSGLSVDLNHDRLVQLQLDVSDYVSGLDETLRNLHQRRNSRLVRRLKAESGAPLSFLYFRVQQEMLRLSGDLTIARERETLSKLTKLLDH
jgi:hypothetical protein